MAVHVDATNPSSTSKSLAPEIDLGHLLVSEIAVVNDEEIQKDREAYLLKHATESVRVLLDSFLRLPTDVVDDVYVVKLPELTTLMPREKPVPKAKPLTRWETFAREKGIRKHKKDKIAFDETTRTWRRTFGYQKANDAENQWLVEVPDHGANPYDDYFGKLEDKKQERVAKNEVNRLRNVARAANVKVPSVGSLTAVASAGGDNKKLLRKRAVDFQAEASVAKEATASTGKFQPSLPKEKPNSKRQRKQKFESNMQNPDTEKNQTLTVLHRLLSKTPTVNVEKASNKAIHDEERERAEAKRIDPLDYSRKAKMSKRRSKAGEHTLHRKATLMKNEKKTVWKTKAGKGGGAGKKSGAGGSAGKGAAKKGGAKKKQGGKKKTKA